MCIFKFFNDFYYYYHTYCPYYFYSSPDLNLQTKQTLPYLISSFVKCHFSTIVPNARTQPVRYIEFKLLLIVSKNIFLKHQVGTKKKAGFRMDTVLYFPKFNFQFLTGRRMLQFECYCTSFTLHVQQRQSFQE